MDRSAKVKKNFKVIFDICTFCNHQCTFCSNSDNRTIKESVKAGDFIKIMDNISNYINVTKLSLSAKGEVLLNKELEEITALAKEKYKIPYVYFSTNGSILNQKRALSILESGVDSIKFSINATNRDSYKKIHLKDDFDEVINNLKNLLEIKKDKFQDVKIFISIVTDELEDKVHKEFKAILQDLYEELNDIFIYKRQYTPRQGKNETKVNIDAKNCLISPFKEIYVNSDCSLGFCCKDYFDEISFGSLLDYDFMKLYNSEEYKNMRQRFIDNNFVKDSLCYNCLVYEGLKR